jgi:hypothetical protein
MLLCAERRDVQEKIKERLAMRPDLVPFAALLNSMFAISFEETRDMALLEAYGNAAVVRQRVYELLAFLLLSFVGDAAQPIVLVLEVQKCDERSFVIGADVMGGACERCRIASIWTVRHGVC